MTSSVGRLAVIVSLLGAAIACKGTPPPSPAKAAPPGRIRFTDVTQASAVRSTWASGSSGHNFYVEQMGGGGAFLDYDQDGRQDFFVAGGGVLPGYRGVRPAGDRLYHNNPDSTFTDVTTSSGIRTDRYTLGAASADYDNDGFPDLFVTTVQGNILYHNDGQGHFVDVTERAGVKGTALSTSAAFLDYDNDGWVDLFVGRYMDYAVIADKGCAIRGMGQQDLNRARIMEEHQKGTSKLPLACGPHVMPTTSSLLYHNNGDGTFADVSTASGISAAQGHALAVGVGDFNDDGLPDIHVASDGYPSLLFMNLGGGKFKEDAARAGVATWKGGRAFAGMGTDTADFDNDGRADLVTSNYEKEPETLYRGRGDGTFIDFVEQSGVMTPSYLFLKWGVRALDFNGDGWRDLMIVAGHVDPAGTPGRPLNIPDENWPGKGFAQEAIVLVGTGTGTFVDKSSSSGQFFKDKHVARGAAFADFDNDGDWDALIVNIDEPAVLLRNDSPGHRWGRLQLEGAGCNRDALGARVRVTTGTLTQTEYVRSGSSYLSDHDRRVLLGLPGSDPALAEIRWPCGAVQTVNVQPGQTVRVKEAGCRLPHRKEVH